MKNRIKEFAEMNKITLEDLAQKAKIGRTTIYSIVRGASIPSIETAYKIATILDTSIETLFCLGEE